MLDLLIEAARLFGGLLPHELLHVLTDPDGSHNRPRSPGGGPPPVSHIVFVAYCSLSVKEKDQKNIYRPGKDLIDAKATIEYNQLHGRAPQG